MGVSKVSNSISEAGATPFERNWVSLWLGTIDLPAGVGV